MKKITTLLGFVGVVCIFSGCSSETEAPSASDENSAVDSSSSETSVAGSSTEVTPGSSASNPGTGISSSEVAPDTVFTQVVVSSGNDSYSDPYFSSGIFCWSKECEEKWAGSSSSAAPKSSSSISIEVTMSSEAAKPPLVSGNQMTDQRDQKGYKIAEIAGKRWMTENINFATKGYFCQTETSDDMCAAYGGFYTYAGALKACPDGWRLPTEAEVTALDAAVDHEWWQIGGRFKIAEDKASDYGLENEQGYIWIQADGEYSSFRIKNYGGGDNLHEFQAGSVTERAYNVRCVEGN